jgi:glycerol-3-phosphate acyltransferase PlsY
MKFKGGKGVATAFGMMIALIPYLALGALALFIVTVWLSHYISLGSCLAAAALGVAVWFLGCPLSLKIVVTLIAAFVIVKHKSNIRRLIDGCENKIY